MMIDEVSEADEAATSSAVALDNLREQVRKGESQGVVAMYERAAWRQGVMHAETDRVIAEERQNADDLSRGFSAGNYANAYETEDYETARNALKTEPSEAYFAAFTLGFFATYELHEMGEHRETYEEAYRSTWGQRCVLAGYCDDRELDDCDCGSCHDHTADEAT